VHLLRANDTQRHRHGEDEGAEDYGGQPPGRVPQEAGRRHVPPSVCARWGGGVDLTRCCAPRGSRRAGGFSFVFLVRDCDSGSLYALKRVLVQEHSEMTAIKHEIQIMVRSRPLCSAVHALLRVCVLAAHSVRSHVVCCAVLHAWLAMCRVVVCRGRERRGNWHTRTSCRSSTRSSSAPTRSRRSSPQRTRSTS
jgi:hypothetical protein